MALDLTTLNKLRKDNSKEFRLQLISKLKMIAAKRTHEDLKEIIQEYKKELITESYFFIDFVNEVLRNILYNTRLDFRLILPELIFISKIGDQYTYELLKKSSDHLKGHQQEMEELQLAMIALEENIMKLEEESEELRLYPMDDIIDRWLD